MRKFELTINLGNDAMQTPEDVSRALRIAADSLSKYGTDLDHGGIWDDNGNRAGEWKFEN